MCYNIIQIILFTVICFYQNRKSKQNARININYMKLGFYALNRHDTTIKLNEKECVPSLLNSFYLKLFQIKVVRELKCSKKGNLM